MIIQLKGTNGTGKSHIARRVMALYEGEVTPKYVDGRKRPVRTVHERADGGRALAVIGHYQTACGGCDTMPSHDSVFAEIRAAHEEGLDVFAEGLLLSGDFKRTIEFHQNVAPMHVLALDVPLEVSMDSINARRRARNPDAAPCKEDNIVSKRKAVISVMNRLKDQSALATWHDREGAFAYIRELLDI